MYDTHSESHTSAIIIPCESTILDVAPFNLAKVLLVSMPWAKYL